MTQQDAEGILGLAVTVSVVSGLVGILYYVWYALALSKLFGRLGGESWRGWVPILNEMEILVRGGVPGWSVVYYFIPIVNLYGLYLKGTAIHRINAGFGRGIGSTILGVLLPPVWASILAWGPQSAGAQPVQAGGDAAPRPATGPLGAPPAPSAAPFTPAASDPSGYALPVVQAPPAAPAPAFSAPDSAPPLPPQPGSGPPAPPAAAPATAAATPPRPAEGLIQNPWAAPAQQVAAAPSAPPAPAAPPAPVTPPPPAGPPAPPAPPAPAPAPAAAPAPESAPAAPPAVVGNDGFIVPPPGIGLPPVAAAPVEAPPAPPAPAAAPAVAPAAASAPAAPPAPPATPVVAFGAPAATGFGASAAADDDEDDLDSTIVVDRTPVVPWTLRTDDGFVAPLTGSTVVLGRNPSSSDPAVQAVAIPDSTKTLSKTHARLQLSNGVWTLTDLHSTNGVVVFAADGSERIIDVDVPVTLQSRFLLGTVGMGLSYEEELRS